MRCRPVLRQGQRKRIPEHHPKSLLCAEGTWGPREGSRQSQRNQPETHSSELDALRANGPTLCTDGKTEALGGQEFTPASPHGTFVQTEQAPHCLNGQNAHGRDWAGVGPLSSLVGPLSSTQPVKPRAGALEEALPTLFLIIHLTKRLS